MKISRKNLLKKWKTTQCWKGSDQERRAVAVSRSNFLFQSGFSQKDDEEKFDHSEKFAENMLLLMAIFCFICFVVVYI